jgi:hypothetical protein
MGWQWGNEDCGTLVNPELRASFAGSFFKPLLVVMNGFINQAGLEPVTFSPIDHSWAPQFCIEHLWGWHPDTHLWRECINSKKLIECSMWLWSDASAIASMKYYTKAELQNSLQRKDEWCKSLRIWTLNILVCMVRTGNEEGLAEDWEPSAGPECSELPCFELLIQHKDLLDF